MQPLFQKGDIVLFQGDSITDAERTPDGHHHLGSGYANMAASWFEALYPERKITFLNRGVSGNRVANLVERWHEDCLTLQPTWISILIGINDIWQHTPDTVPASLDAYEEAHRTLLEQSKKHLPNVRFIFCEPFLLPLSPRHEEWRVLLDPTITRVRRLAREYSSLFVPFDGLFAQAAARREPAFWASDGIHPTQAGHALMARAWLQTVQALPC